jgi:uncharacterized protein
VVQFTLDAGAPPNLIRGYSVAEILIGSQRVTRSCIVTAQQLVTEWAPASFAELSLDHLAAIFALEPDVVLLGTGPTQRFPDAPLRGVFAARRIGLEVMELGAACRTFNVLVQEERRVAAALFLS